MPQARVREGKRYRYWRETGAEVKRDRYGRKRRRSVGEWVFAEEGEVVEVSTNALKCNPDFLEPVGVVEPIGEQDEPYSDTGKVLDGKWHSVCKRVSEIDDPELLLALREAELNGRARGSVVAAIDVALAECGVEIGGEIDEDEVDDDDDGEGDDGE